MEPNPSQTRLFQTYAWIVLACNVAVILWGAVVRATGSGAGCGEHWPLCNGVAVPQSPQVATIIEFVHRLTSGLAVGLALGLVALAFVFFPKRHLVRRAAATAVFFEFMEALLGAALVLLGHVAKDPSVARGYYLSAHLVNTMMLLAALTLAAWASGRSGISIRSGAAGWRFAFAIAGAGLLLLGVSGVIAALGDTLFHSTSLAQGFRQDLVPSSHPFLRLRVWHPLIAVLVSLGIEALCFATRARVVAWILGALTLTQIAAGMINLALLAPVPMQIFHLLLADAVWIAFIILAADVLLESSASPQRAASSDFVLTSVK
jgi:heme A synthase